MAQLYIIYQRSIFVHTVAMVHPLSIHLNNIFHTSECRYIALGYIVYIYLYLYLSFSRKSVKLIDTHFKLDYGKSRDSMYTYTIIYRIGITRSNIIIHVSNVVTLEKVK